jgi:hypothetical protein
VASNLILRGRTWWVRIDVKGQTIRRSARTKDRSEAEAFRDSLLKRIRPTGAPRDWQAHVLKHLRTPTSWLRRTHSRIVRKSAKKDWHWCMTLAELQSLMLASHGRCSITGLPFERRVGPAKLPGPYDISIDRIDATEGYTLENCRLVLLAGTLGMQRWGEVEFTKIATAVAANPRCAGMFLGIPASRPKKTARKSLNLVEREGLEPSTPAL